MNQNIASYNFQQFSSNLATQKWASLIVDVLVAASVQRSDDKFHFSHAMVAATLS